MSDLTMGATSADQWLGTRPMSDWQAEFDARGFIIFENVLDHRVVEKLRAALEPHLTHTGRNDFEGLKSNRVYALLAKDPIFADLVTHPLAMAFVEAELGASCLLSACLAIKLHPGESVQPWHYDDSHLQVARPRPAFGVSTFWTIDDTTEENGATEIIPGSHLWGDESPNETNLLEAFDDRTIKKPEDDPSARDDAIKTTMPAGSLMIAKGTLWHRGGANKSTKPRLIITPQYCPGWSRQLENMVLAVPPAQAKHLPPRAQALLGYSIHPPFMGYVDGAHPNKVMG